MCVLILIVSESIILTIRNHHTGSSITIAFIAIIIIIIAFIIGIPILQSSWLLGIWISWLPWISWLSGR